MVESEPSSETSGSPGTSDTPGTKPAGTAHGVLRRLRSASRELLRFAARPLTLSQVLSSASGALSVVLAAAVLGRAEFALFALYNLVTIIVTGLGMAALFYPALIHLRDDPTSFVRGRAVAAFALPMMAATALVCGAVGASPAEAGMLGLAMGCQPVYDWLRYRAVGLEQRWLVAAADALRFVTVVALVAVTWVHSAAALQVTLLLALLLPAALLWAAGRRPGETTPYATYARSAGWQVADYVAGQFVLAVPLLVLGSAASGGTVAGIRLAQSLLGPLNLAFSASVANLIADGSTRAALASADALIRTGSKISRVLGLTAALGVAAVIALLLLTGLELRGVANDDIVVGLVVVGTYSILSGWSGVHGTTIRLLGRQALVTGGRVLIAGAAVGGFALGYVLSGPTASVAAGFVIAGAASLGVFAPMARSVYRSERTRGART